MFCFTGANQTFFENKQYNFAWGLYYLRTLNAGGGKSQKLSNPQITKTQTNFESFTKKTPALTASELLYQFRLKKNQKLKQTRKHALFQTRTTIKLFCMCGYITHVHIPAKIACMPASQDSWFSNRIYGAAKAETWKAAQLTGSDVRSQAIPVLGNLLPPGRL